MSEDIDIGLLEKYKNGEITAKEVLCYDGTPVTEEELKVALEDFENLTIQLKAVDLGKRLKCIHEDVVKKADRKVNIQRWSAAASLILLATFSFLLLNPSEPKFSEYFTHFNELVTFRDSDSMDYAEGLEAYTRKDYNAAYISLKEIENLSDELKFYLGISALGSERPSEAILTFKQLSRTSSNEYYQQTKWYLGLAYWKMGDLKRAIALWESIPASEFKYEESRELIEKLRD